MSWLITGGTGFVGQALTRRALAEGKDVRLALRRPIGHTAARSLMVGQIDGHTRWQAALESVDTVLHLAARVHVINEKANDPLTAFRDVNTVGTLNLARQAAAAGVRRLVFLSSIKVNGEHTAPGRPFTADQPARPEDPYGQSKWEAELGLRALGAETGLEVVIVRPPLVYGPGVRANFAALLRAVDRGWPLPLASVTGNRRSLVALDNLVDLLVTDPDNPRSLGWVAYTLRSRLRRMGHLADGATLPMAERLPALIDLRPDALWPLYAVSNPELPLQATLVQCQSAAREVSDQLCSLFFTHSGQVRYSVNT
jgi:nucleoside-diphosphate-sugar epimerase